MFHQWIQTEIDPDDVVALIVNLIVVRYDAEFYANLPIVEVAVPVTTIAPAAPVATESPNITAPVLDPTEKADKRLQQQTAQLETVVHSEITDHPDVVDAPSQVDLDTVEHQPIGEVDGVDVPQPENDSPSLAPDTQAAEVATEILGPVLGAKIQGDVYVITALLANPDDVLLCEVVPLADYPELEPQLNSTRVLRTLLSGQLPQQFVSLPSEATAKLLALAPPKQDKAFMHWAQNHLDDVNVTARQMQLLLIERNAAADELVDLERQRVADMDVMIQHEATTSSAEVSSTPAPVASHSTISQKRRLPAATDVVTKPAQNNSLTGSSDTSDVRTSFIRGASELEASSVTAEKNATVQVTSDITADASAPVEQPVSPDAVAKVVQPTASNVTLETEGVSPQLIHVEDVEPVPTANLLVEGDTLLQAFDLTQAQAYYQSLPNSPETQQRLEAIQAYRRTSLALGKNSLAQAAIEIAYVAQSVPELTDLWEQQQIACDQLQATDSLLKTAESETHPDALNTAARQISMQLYQVPSVADAAFQNAIDGVAADLRQRLQTTTKRLPELTLAFHWAQVRDALAKVDPDYEVASQHIQQTTHINLPLTGVGAENKNEARTALQRHLAGDWTRVLHDEATIEARHQALSQRAAHLQADEQLGAVSKALHRHQAHEVLQEKIISFCQQDLAVADIAPQLAKTNADILVSVLEQIDIDALTAEGASEVQPVKPQRSWKRFVPWRRQTAKPAADSNAPNAVVADGPKATEEPTKPLNVVQTTAPKAAPVSAAPTVSASVAPSVAVQEKAKPAPTNARQVPILSPKRLTHVMQTLVAFLVAGALLFGIGYFLNDTWGALAHAEFGRSLSDTSDSVLAMPTEPVIFATLRPGAAQAITPVPTVAFSGAVDCANTIEQAITLFDLSGLGEENWITKLPLDTCYSELSRDAETGFTHIKVEGWVTKDDIKLIESATVDTLTIVGVEPTASIPFFVNKSDFAQTPQFTLTARTQDNPHIVQLLAETDEAHHVRLIGRILLTSE